LVPISKFSKMLLGEELKSSAWWVIRGVLKPASTPQTTNLWVIYLPHQWLDSVVAGMLMCMLYGPIWCDGEVRLIKLQEVWKKTNVKQQPTSTLKLASREYVTMSTSWKSFRPFKFYSIFIIQYSTYCILFVFKKRRWLTVRRQSINFILRFRLEWGPDVFVSFFAVRALQQRPTTKVRETPGIVYYTTTSRHDTVSRHKLFACQNKTEESFLLYIALLFFFFSLSFQKLVQVLCLTMVMVGKSGAAPKTYDYEFLVRRT